MFQLYPEALDAEVDRRREVALMTMRNGRSPAQGDRRPAGVARARHALITLAAMVRSTGA